MLHKESTDHFFEKIAVLKILKAGVILQNSNIPGIFIKTYNPFVKSCPFNYSV